MVSQLAKPGIVYPTSDGEPVAETFDHLYVLITTLMALRHYLAGQQATVLADQFLYYVEGQPNARVAPDVMVIFNVEPGGRDSYKIWEEGESPSVIFEMTSKGTADKDIGFKKGLYEQLGVSEYWLYDPRGEWITEKLRGYRLRQLGDRSEYEPITDGRSAPLGLRVEIEDSIIAFYREDTGEKLLVPDELVVKLEGEIQQRREFQKVAEAESIQRQKAEAARQDVEAKRRAMVSQLLSAGVPPEQIVETSGLSLEEIQAIQAG